MPSVILASVSGGTNILSGYSASGHISPVGGIQLRVDKACSGNIYVGLSGGVTIQSGGFALSGGGISGGVLDGFQLGPGDAYFIPRLGLGTSGHYQVYVAPDANCSGQARLYFEVY